MGLFCKGVLVLGGEKVWGLQAWKGCGRSSCYKGILTAAGLQPL